MSSSADCNDDSSSKSNDEVNDMLQNMSTADEEDILSICANCGKEGSDVNNICNKCKQVKYCNADCKKKHRHKHKKQCERYVAKLHDEELFKQPPPLDDCPICMIQLPSLNPSGKKYMACCGKTICSGCAYAPVYDNQGNEVDDDLCPFCRVPQPESDEEVIKRTMKRVEVGDANAIYNHGNSYFHGVCGYPQDYTKALELFHQSAELGCVAGYNNIGYAYYNGEGVEIDKEKALYYYKLAAIGGDVCARCNLGLDEEREGNMDRALKHYMMAVRCGHVESLDFIKEFYSNGNATKEEYTKALQLYQAYLGEIKSDKRDEAALFSDEYKYYYAN